MKNEAKIKTKAASIKENIRFQVSENLAGEEMLWLDMYGSSYVGYTKKEAAKLVEFLQRKAIPMLKQYAKSKKSR